MSPAAFTLIFVARARRFARRPPVARPPALAARPSRREAVPSAFAGRISLAAHRKAADYTIERTRFDMLVTVFSAAAARADAGRRTVGAGRPDRRARAAAAAARPHLRRAGRTGPGRRQPPVCLVDRRSASRPRFGFNRMTPAHMVRRPGQGHRAAALLGLPLVALTLWLMRAAGPAWWLWVWAAWIGLPLLLLVLYPSVIAPLFNKFTPLADGGARERVEAPARALRLRQQGPLRDGRLAPLRPRQRLLHRVRARQSASCSSTPCSTRSARRARGRARPRARALQAPARRQAHRRRFA